MASKLRMTFRGQTYEFSEETSSNTELMALEEATGHEFGEILDKLNKGSVRAMTWILWLCLRREQPDLALADLQFRPSEIVSELIDDEQDPGKDEPASPEK